MYVSRIVTLASTLCLALGLTMAQAEDMEVDATIQKVNEDTRSLTVEMESTGATKTFRVDDDTRISFGHFRGEAGELRSGFEDLRAGQEVTLRFDEQTVDPDYNYVILRFITIS